MNIIHTLEWIETTDLSIAIREGALPYPIIGGVHLLAIALFGGMLLATDLRLLGWGMQRYSITDVVTQFRNWKRFGFVMVVASGVLLGWGEPLKLYRSPAFWVKMALLALVFVHAIAFRKSVYANTAELDKASEIPLKAKIAAALSVILWIGLTLSGRLIAFDT
jgi:hypothetical protein